MPNTIETKGIHMGQSQYGGSFSAKNVIEDFMKNEYQEGLRNEFNMMDALINRLPKEQISAKFKYKSFALGVTDNIRALGSNNYDLYELGMSDFNVGGVETVEAKFDTTKLMATFAITDEAILKGTGDGSLLDVLKDSLDRMEIGLKHTMNRYTYGSNSGLIGKAAGGFDMFTIPASAQVANATDRPNDPRGDEHNKFYGNAPTVIKFAFANSQSILPGMGIMIQNSNIANAVTKRYVGRVWQKAQDPADFTKEYILMIVEGGFTGTGGNLAAGNKPSAKDTADYFVYSRQLDNTKAVAREYTGLEDIVVSNDTTIFGVDRTLYPQLRGLKYDLQGKQYLGEELLRDVSDALATSSPDGTSITLCCATHRVISTIEKQLYQLKTYDMDTSANGFQLGGRPDIRFDNMALVKDKFARDNNLYMLDQAKIGELVRRDFTWITNGEQQGVLQRRPGTELYEGIMNKYADMYVDAFKCHGVITNCAVAQVSGFDGSYARNVVVTNTVKTEEQGA